jgi:hypothetical protein
MHQELVTVMFLLPSVKSLVVLLGLTTAVPAIAAVEI